MNWSAARRRLSEWYRRSHRPLPWRRDRDPWRILVAEVMLQQTRVSAVLGYYEPFLKRYPDAASLAGASDSELLAAWSGLGYYSRARNLQRAARRIVELGSFPSTYEDLRKLAGVGDYTAAAVASIAFDLPHAAVDGNVSRVVARLTAENGQAARGADLLLDRRNPGLSNQAAMELGATVCVPNKPDCPKCPLETQCRARRLGIETEFPARTRRAVRLREERTVLVIRDSGRLLLRRRPPDSRRLAGFWELPEAVDLPAARPGGEIGSFRHSIVNHDYRFSVRTASVRGTPAGFEWVAEPDLARLPLATTTRKALNRLRSAPNSSSLAK